MKKILKKKIPFIYEWIKKEYYNLPYIREREEEKNKKKLLEQKKKKMKELKIMNDVFNNEYIVHNGPFEGMLYMSEAYGSQLLPKILGSYEEPIQDWIYEIINEKHYTTILDIGSAEGYYAVGFALKLPQSNIIAYDINEIAREKIKKLKILNKVKNLEIKSECTHTELNLLSQNNVLIFCDIEGAEINLLDPIKVPNLKTVDILVEAHDCFVPGVTEALINRFYKTHKIRIVIDYPFRIKKYCTPNPMSAEQYIYIIDERRPPQMKFMYMEKGDGRI